MSRVVVHLDLDCFYAQVETMRNPSLRGRPVGVRQKTLIVTTNYEARKMGVGKMARASEAQAKFPELVVVDGECLDPYRDASDDIHSLMSTMFPECPIRRLGLDELFIDVTEPAKKLPAVESEKWVGGLLTPAALLGEEEANKYWAEQGGLDTEGHRLLRAGAVLAFRARTLLKEKLEYTCSAGIALGPTLAKIVGNRRKPDNQTALLPLAHWALIGDMLLKKIPGCGRAVCARFAEVGLTCVSEIKDMSLSRLRAIVGQPCAEFLFNLCAGIDSAPVVSSGPPKTMSEEDIVYSCQNAQQLAARMRPMIESLMRRVDEDESRHTRLPQTLRVTVRPAANPYRSGPRSKQVPLGKDVLRSAGRVDAVLGLVEQQLKCFDFRIGVVNIGLTKFTELPVRAKRGLDEWCEQDGDFGLDADTPLGEDADGGCDSAVCGECGAALPAWAMEAHIAFHQDSD